MSTRLLPSQRYADGVRRGDWREDASQRTPLQALDRVFTELCAQPAKPSLLTRLLRPAPAAAPRGLYLWGGVGRGKTFLIDLFYNSLPFKEKRRTHFHRFMRELHEQLRIHAGERDPLVSIAKKWRHQLRVLVLDEFFVSDIGDAMLLGRLLERLFAEGVCLVTTSNAAPSDLYKDGLQRARFLPAIALIEQHCEIVELISDTDYRLRALTKSPVYHTPLDAQSDHWLEQRWHEIGCDDAHRDAGIEIDGRRLPVRGRCKGMCWFDFDALCEGPRSTTDYIEVAREFHTILLGGIPHFDAHRDDAARRFIHLVDELYDRNVNLICTAATNPVTLYSGERLRSAFERTTSRLIEMQSTTYLAQEHLSE
jgi:cell division protein ZapE